MRIRERVCALQKCDCNESVAAWRLMISDRKEFNRLDYEVLDLELFFGADNQRKVFRKVAQGHFERSRFLTH